MAAVMVLLTCSAVSAGEEFTLEMYNAQLSAEWVDERQEYINILMVFVGLFFVFVVPIVAVRVFLRKLPCSTQALEKIFRPKFLRATYVVIMFSGALIWIQGLGISITEKLTNGREEDIIFALGYEDLQMFVSLAVVVFILALIATFFVMLWFTDMTRKQVAVSAVIAVVVETVVVRIFGLSSLTVLHDVHWIFGNTAGYFLRSEDWLYDGLRHNFWYNMFWSVGFAAILVLTARCRKVSSEQAEESP